MEGWIKEGLLRDKRDELIKFIVIDDKGKEELKAKGYEIQRQQSGVINEDVVKSLSIYQEKIAALQDLGLGFESCTRKDLLEDAIEFQKKYGLLANDSVVLATALRLGAEVLVSADTAFRQIVEPAVASPSDLRI